MALTNEVIDSYKLFLEVKYPAHWRKYCNLLKSNSQGAKAEAVVFSLLRTVFDEITLAEDVSTGGPDFLCRVDDIEFIVEVTSLEAESVANQSGWENVIPEDTAAGCFRMITHKVRAKASTKAPQLSGYDIPRVLVITCEHVAADILIGSHGAEVFFTGEPKIEVPIGRPIGNIGEVTDLRDSLFFDVNNGMINPARRSISAIFLLAVLAHESSVLGILHPDPQFRFPVMLFPSVPFLKMKKGPPQDREIELEWVIHKPSPWKFYHREIKFKDADLRSI